MLRWFVFLGVRVALSMQHELAVLERELADLDATYARDADPSVSSGCFEEDQEDREMLLRGGEVEAVLYVHPGSGLVLSGGLSLSLPCGWGNVWCGGCGGLVGCCCLLKLSREAG